MGSGSITTILRLKIRVWQNTPALPFAKIRIQPFAGSDADHYLGLTEMLEHKVTPSDFYLIGPLKVALHEKRYIYKNFTKFKIRASFSLRSWWVVC